MKTTKRILVASLLAASVILSIVLSYVLYVVIAYERIDDHLSLAVEDGSDRTLSPGQTYTALTWNIGFGAYSDDYSFFMDGGEYSRGFSEEAVRQNVEAMAARMTALSPDILLVQEVDIDGTRSYHIDERVLLRESLVGYGAVFCQNYDSPYFFYPFASPHGKNASGMLTLSPYAMQDSVRRSLPVEEGFYKFLDLDRCYSVTRMPVDGGRELCVYNLHLSAYTTDGTIATQQLQLLIEDMCTEYERGNYILAGGDFNKDLLGDSSMVFGVSGEDYTWAQPIPDGVIPLFLTLVAADNAPSCRQADRPYGPDNFVLTVDGFLVSDTIEIVSYATVDEAFAHSDHNPVTLTFRLIE